MAHGTHVETPQTNKLPRWAACHKERKNDLTFSVSFEAQTYQVQIHKK